MTIHRVFAIVFSSGKRKEINNLQKWAMTLLSRLGEFCCAVDQGYLQMCSILGHSLLAYLDVEI